MEFNFSPWRLSVLAGFLAAFAYAGGFQQPVLEADGIFDAQKIAKAWMGCVALFAVGAVSATIVDHFVGNLERSNLRFLYIIIGAVLMASGFLWLKSLKQTVEKRKMASAALFNQNICL